MKTELFLEMQIRRYYARNGQDYMVMPIPVSQEHQYLTTSNLSA